MSAQESLSNSDEQVSSNRRRSSREKKPTRAAREAAEDRELTAGYVGSLHAQRSTISTASNLASPPPIAPSVSKFSDHASNMASIRNSKSTLDQMYEKLHQTLKNTRPVSFAADEVLIYQWPPSRQPRNFTDLSDSDRRWRAKQDAIETESDIDDGADDWEEFAGDPELYDSRSSLEYVVASAFVNRAKRASRAGKCWEEFEAEELAADPLRAVKEVEEPERRELLRENALDNGLRLAVFDAVKERLCGEIWSQDYASIGAASEANRRDSKGVVKPPTAGAEASEGARDEGEQRVTG